MKLNGQKLSTMNNQIIIIPRTDGDMIFKAAPVLDMAEFNTLYPEPKPPMIRRRGESTDSPDMSDKKFKETLEKRSKAYSLYMIIKSLMATEGLEFETVDIKNPETYINMEKELEDSGLTSVERGRLFQGVMRANSLDMEYIEEARKRFFASEQQKVQPQ